MNCASLVYKVEAKLGNNLIEVHLCDTFLYYLFAYDDVSTFEWSTMILEDKGANRVNKGVLDPCSLISFPFDPGNELNCGICLVMLGQDDKNNLEEFVGAFSYDGKFFLRVYNLLEGPTLCMGKGSFLALFLYYLFAYDLVDCASYGDKSYLSREEEVYLKFVMLSLCVPSCDVMSARILKPSFNLAYRNTLDDSYVHDTFLYYLFAYDESHICLKWALHFGRGLDSRTNPFQEGEDDNNMDSMDRVKALGELDGHKIKKYNVWKGLSAEGFVLSRDILVGFVDCVGLPCASSKWFSIVDSGLSFGIMSQLRPSSLGHDKLGIRATPYPRVYANHVRRCIVMLLVLGWDVF
ncbi:hypothetical protein MTR67_030940 [Solanum verrucosum]|uniref:Uncharacterized protein n=1 Tax=Solanum verrucosum TaxID=315347 RepID=A0AAF0U1H9_SOLVR|nr:hypothetical protein MTR67_030940 [Solanum verrucosum]